VRQVNLLNVQASFLSLHWWFSMVAVGVLKYVHGVHMVYTMRQTYATMVFAERALKL
jgi:hypothetical protein